MQSKQVVEKNRVTRPYNPQLAEKKRGAKRASMHSGLVRNTKRREARD